MESHIVYSIFINSLAQPGQAFLKHEQHLVTTSETVSSAGSEFKLSSAGGDVSGSSSSASQHLTQLSAALTLRQVAGLPSWSCGDTSHRRQRFTTANDIGKASKTTMTSTPWALSQSLGYIWSSCASKLLAAERAAAGLAKLVPQLKRRNP